MVTLNGRDFYTFEEYQEAKASAAFPAVLAQIKMQIPGTSPVSYYTAEDAIKNRYHGRLLFHFGNDWEYFLSAFTDLANSLAADFTAKTAVINSLLAKLQANVVSSKIENKRADAGYTNFENAYSDGGTISTADAGNANIGTIIQYQNQIKNLFDETIDDFRSLFLAYNPVSEDCGNTSIPTGTKKHSELENLDYASSGHTGFQSTIADLDTIRSGASAGATAVQPSALSGYATNAALQQGLAGKQDTISDLAAIRSGASAGATAVQPSALSGYATNTALQQGLATREVVGACYTKSEADALIGAKSVVSGENNGTNWTALTVNGVRKTIPARSAALYVHSIRFYHSDTSRSGVWRFIATQPSTIRDFDAIWEIYQETALKDSFWLWMPNVGHGFFPDVSGILYNACDSMSGDSEQGTYTWYHLLGYNYAYSASDTTPTMKHTAQLVTYNIISHTVGEL